MNTKMKNRLLSILLCFVIIFGMIPASVLTVHAGHTCDGCEEWIDGSPYCSECYQCDECIDLCLECGKCTDCTGAEICDGCSDEESGNMCTDCSTEKGAHCPNCDTCYYIAQSWCEQCGSCETCEIICDSCSVNLGEGLICEECAIDKNSHCPGCNGCYFESGIWCEECELCDSCAPHDENCSIAAGAILCKECAADRGNHCTDCGQCYFDVGSWCEECGKCEDCSPACVYCCEEAGAVICEECAIESGMHCPDCSDCYQGGEYCLECGICTACADICSSDELCTDCAIAGGYHCPNCEECCDQAILCEGCGEYCLECADEFCESCNLCSECALVCQGCGACSECADICPNCEEYCSECEGLCDDCEFCLICCADIASLEGCDCSDWVCVESGDWQEHFDNEHTESDGSHSVRPVPTWEWDDTYHWHKCAYCDEADHFTGNAKHSYDASGKCTTCNYSKNEKIQIIVQPKDSKNALVSSVWESPDERNVADFSIKAVGKGELTYTWYEGYYSASLGAIKYTKIDRDPEEYENFDGPFLSVYVPSDACYSDWYVRCVVTDENGNEAISRDALVQARHEYHYYEGFKNHVGTLPGVQRSRYGHVLQCIGEGCEKVTHLLPHEDEDRDGYCDECDFAVGNILITKQPKDDSSVYVSSAIEDYDESNYAHFSVKAQGESELTYTWCRKMYVNGVLTYVPLSNPGPNECYDGPDASIWVPTDACYNTYYYACFITDEEDNEVKTVDVAIRAKHNYQYYQQYQTHQNPYFYARRKYIGHVLCCVGEGCEKVTRYRQHVDENRDYICDICDSQKDFTEIALTVTAPKEGALPNYNVVTDSVAYYAMGGSSNYTQYRFWFVSDNGTDNWKLIDKTTPFVAGKYYKFVVEMQTKTGYTFPTYNSEPSFWAKVNGDYVMPQKIYGMDPTRYVTVSYEFGVCNDSVIENIVIENVTTPVAGEKPNYSATVRGGGYYIDSSKNAQLDDYWNNPQQKPHYIKNGIGWFDMTEFDWVYENETFIPGHEYQVRVYLKTEDGYTFYHDKWLEMLFTASVNGFGAEGNTTTSDGLYNQTISASFPCQGKEIYTIMVNGISVPRAGETPDYTASAAYPEWYQLDSNYGGTGGIIWFDSQGNQLEPTDTFVEGEKYKIEIKIVPTKLNGANVSQFVSPYNAYVNGKQITAYGDWDAVYGNANAVYIYYTFPNGASAPIITNYQFTNQPKGATLALDEWHNTNWELNFVPTMTEIQIQDGGIWDQFDVQYPQNKLDDYDFGGLGAGTYLFRIVAYVGNQVKAISDEFTITWEKPYTEYKVSYNANGGSGTMIGDMVEENGKFTLENCTYVAPEGYKFKAWAIGSVNGEQKQPGEQITITGNTYVYAVWEAVQVIPNGWRLESGKWYFYENGAKVKSAWRKDSNGWCWLSASGAMATNQWVKDSKGWCYVGANGYCWTNRWAKDSIGWIWLDSEGSMTKSKWILDGGKWYYLDANGYMVSNQWRKDSKGWCWLTASGAMATNQWVKDSKGWCYVGADGYCWTNRWAKDSIGWIWLDSEGSMTKSKWILDGGKWYYLDANGYMVANTTITISGKRYTFNASGVWVG